ncbi:uncharacterized protein BJ212DRAFT_1514841 [Suillus subaureus]|uniref:Uncharacterized protein n=1 Tax=Suillus subaureus TaxID=48587 RepID=A0A9P7JCB7_9AGAM|nr:uncharacterized protein BJ212DRAFT_1514841 [Suillus subaureus]KAG1813985.1 hypothetical protein BJ212DRAFT_1514841 [Suillus subaureus]
MIYEFDALTLKTVGAPFKGHTHDTIKLQAFESRQPLASFDVKYPFYLILLPVSRQLAYTSWNDCNIYICNIPADILASIGLAEEPQPSTNTSERSRRVGLLNSDATHRPMSRKTVIIHIMSPIPRPLSTRDPHTFLSFLRKHLPSDTDAFPATSPLPRPLIKPEENSQPTPAPPTTQFSVVNTPATLKFSLYRMSTWRPFQTDHAADAPLAPGKLRYATASAPGDDGDLIRDEDCQHQIACKRLVLSLLLTAFKLIPGVP